MNGENVSGQEWPPQDSNSLDDEFASNSDDSPAIVKFEYNADIKYVGDWQYDTQDDPPGVGEIAVTGGPIGGALFEAIKFGGSFIVRLQNEHESKTFTDEEVQLRNPESPDEDTLTFWPIDPRAAGSLLPGGPEDEV